MGILAAQKEAIEVHFQTEWTLLHSLVPIEFPNVSAENTKDFVRLTFKPVDSFRETITGSSPTGQKETGLLIIQVFVPANTKSIQATKYADDVKAIFNELRLPVSGPYDDICFGVPNIVDLGNTSPEWYQINVNCPFSQLLLG